VPKKGDKVKIEKKPKKPKKTKNHVPGPGAYGVGSVWNLDKDNKNQDIQKKRTKSAYRSIYYSKYR
jgi:hypothetical protein